MDATVTPFLMFQGEASGAIELYVSTVPNSRVLELQRYGAGEPGPEGSVKMALVSIGGQRVRINDSPIRHAFAFTPSFSLFVDCASEQELDGLVAALGDGGSQLMAPGNYGFSRKFCWLADRFGVSWQLNWGELAL